MKPKWPKIEGSYRNLNDDEFKEFMKKIGFGRNSHVSGTYGEGYVYIERNGQCTPWRRFENKKDKERMIADAVRQCEKLPGISYVCVTFIQHA